MSPPVFGFEKGRRGRTASLWRSPAERSRLGHHCRSGDRSTKEAHLPGRMRKSVAQARNVCRHVRLCKLRAALQIAYHRCSRLNPRPCVRSPSEASIVIRRFRSRPWNGIVTVPPCECIDPNHRFHQSMCSRQSSRPHGVGDNCRIVPAMSGVLPAYRCV